MAETMIDRVAKAIKAETDKFDMPVNLYIEPEAGTRFERDSPGKDRIFDSGYDDLESYRIIARAVITAIRDEERQSCFDLVGELVGHSMYHIKAGSKGDDDMVFNDAIHAAQRALKE